MNIILKSAKVINAESKYNGTQQDILISEGKIIKIAKSIYEKNAKIINIKGLHVSNGLTVVFHSENLDLKKEKLLRTGPLLHQKVDLPMWF